MFNYDYFVLFYSNEYLHATANEVRREASHRWVGLGWVGQLLGSEILNNNVTTQHITEMNETRR
jgi:hypothetical protein